jgi:hypothetical protein
MTPLMSSIPRLMASKDSSKTFLPAQREQAEEGGGGGGKSEEEVGESEQGKGEDKEERGEEGRGEVGVMGGGGGGWWGGGQIEPWREDEGVTMTVEPFDTTSIRRRERRQVRSGGPRRQIKCDGRSGSDERLWGGDTLMALR